jgi:hypothetical protein
MVVTFRASWERTWTEDSSRASRPRIAQPECLAVVRSRLVKPSRYNRSYASITSSGTGCPIMNPWSGQGPSPGESWLAANIHRDIRHNRETAREHRTALEALDTMGEW